MNSAELQEEWERSRQQIRPGSDQAGRYKSHHNRNKPVLSLHKGSGPALPGHDLVPSAYLSGLPGQDLVLYGYLSGLPDHDLVPSGHRSGLPGG